MESVLRYIEDVDVVFTKKNSSLLTLERRQWIRMLCDNSSLYKQKLVKPKRDVPDTTLPDTGFNRI